MGIVERLSVCRPPNWEDEGREYVVPCDEAADAILALIRERDEALERERQTFKDVVEINICAEVVLAIMEWEVVIERLEQAITAETET